VILVSPDAFAQGLTAIRGTVFDAEKVRDA